MLDLSRGPLEPAAVDAPPADRTILTVVAVVLGLVAVVTVLSLLSGGNDEPSTGSPETTAPTTRPQGTATTLPRPSSSTHPVLAEGERLTPAFGMAVVSIRQNGTVAVADLSTGAEHVLSERIPVAPIQSASWNADTFLVRSTAPALHRLVPGTEDEWEVVDTLDLVADPYGTGPPGLVMLWDPRGDRTPVAQFGRVSGDGPLRPVEAPAGLMVGAPVGWVGEAAVLNSVEGIVLAEPGGALRRLSVGAAFGAADGRLVRRSCDDAVQCRLLVDDLVTGTVLDLGPIDAGSEIDRAVLSPSGDAVALVAPAGDELSLRVLPLAGGQPFTWLVGQRWSQPHMLQWSQDGDGLVWLDLERREARAVRWRGDAPSSEPMGAALADIADPSFYEVLFIVPLADLPPGWVPPAGE